MTTIEQKILEFERTFCNNHQKPIRFLRGVFFDEQDGAEQIEAFIRQALEQVRQETIEECEKAVPKEEDELEFGIFDEFGTFNEANQYNVGFNACRSETLANLNNLK